MGNFFIVLFATFFAQSVFAMSPIQVQKKVKEFNNVLSKYKEKINEGEGLTSEAKKLKTSAQAILNQIKPYTSIAVFESSLRAASTIAEELYEQEATAQFNHLANFFGFKDKTRGIPTKTDVLRGIDMSYYMHLKDEMQRDMFDILARIYSFDEKKTRLSENNSLILGGKKDKGKITNRDVDTFSELTISKKGGALYWMDRFVNDVFDFMNVYGDVNGQQIYGDSITGGTYLNFITARDAFYSETHNVLHMIYPKNTKDEFGKTSKTILLPKDSYEQYSYFYDKVDTTIFGQLHKDLNQYNTLISFVTGIGIDKDDYDPNIRSTLSSIQKTVTDKKLTYATNKTFESYLNDAIAMGEKEGEAKGKAGCVDGKKIGEKIEALLKKIADLNDVSRAQWNAFIYNMENNDLKKANDSIKMALYDAHKGINQFDHIKNALFEIAKIAYGLKPFEKLTVTKK